MRLKTLVVSVVVLALVSVAVFLATRPGPAPMQDPRVGQPIVDRPTVENATKLQLSDQGKTVTLVRQPDGTWRDTSYYDLPADFSKLSSFVGNLREAKIDRFVTANPERLSRLEFKDTRIELSGASGKPAWQLTLGKNAESGGRFVKFDDEKKAYLASLNAWLDNDAKNWADAELVNLKADDIAKIELTFSPTTAPEAKGGEIQPPAVTLTRAKKDVPWTSPQTPPKDQVKADKVSSILSYVDNLRFTDTSDPTDANVAAAKAHERTVKLITFDGKTYTIAMGRKPEEKKLKAPVATTDGKTGPAAMGSVADLEKKEGKAAEKSEAKKPGEAKPAAPEFETIPAGPVYAFVSSSESSAPINRIMQKRAFQVGDYVFTGLPQKSDELFEPAPTPPPPKPDAKNAGEVKSPAKK